MLHLLVDGLCVCALYLMVGNADGARLLALFLAYNVLAFMTQPLTGWWADRNRSRHGPLLVAIVLLSAAVALQMVAVLRGADLLPLCAVLLGMGNSFFHVWGGKQTAVLSGNDMRSLGIFVSSGVLGLTVGVLYASWWLLAAMLLLVSVLGAVVSRIEPSAVPLPPSTRRETAGLPSMAKTCIYCFLAAGHPHLCLAAVVCGRGRFRWVREVIGSPAVAGRHGHGRKGLWRMACPLVGHQPCHRGLSGHCGSLYDVQKC